MAVSLLATALGNGLVTVALALLGHGVWALVWGTLARQAVFTLAAIAFAPPPRRVRAGRHEAAQLLGTGAGFSALALLANVSGQAVRLVLAATLGAAALGLYTRAQALSVVTSRLNPLLRGVLMPAMARRQRRIDRLRIALLNGVELLSLAALPASVMIAVSAPEIVAVVLGAQWDAAVPALRVLALAGAVHALDAVHVPLVRALGAVYRETWRRLLHLVLTLAAAWFASPWGLLGVTAAVAAASLVLRVLLAHLALRLLGVGAAAFLARLAPALWVALWAAPAVYLVAGAVRAAGWTPVAALTVQSLAWCGACAAAAYLAPPFARPGFPHWGLAQLPLAAMGRPGRWARRVLLHLARRWAPAPAVPAP